MGKIFRWNDARLYLGAFCCVCFLAYPWELFSRSVLLYAYVIGLALLPGFIALLTDCFDIKKGTITSFYIKPRSSTPAQTFVRNLIVLCTALATIALSHPSAFFSAILFLICYISLFIIASTKKQAVLLRVSAVILWLFVCIVTWYCLYNAPIMHDVVTCFYNAKGGILSGIARLALIWAPHVGAQYILGAIVCIGILGCALDKERRWLLAPYALTASFCLVCLTVPPGTIRFFVTGFWYNHATRLMATLAIICIPIAAQGFGLLSALIEHIAVNKSQGHSSNRLVLPIADKLTKSPLCMRKIGLVVILSLAAAIICLPLPLPQSTTLTSYAAEMHNYNNPNYKTSFLRQDEREFLASVSSVIESEELVLNAPHDGSAFAYPLYGINTMARSFHPYQDKKSILLARHINEIAYDEEIARTAKKLGVAYVLQLDAPGSQKPTVYQEDYDPSDWEGIFAITEETPGFDLVLSKEDMRLYRILS